MIINYNIDGEYKDTLSLLTAIIDRLPADQESQRLKNIFNSLEVKNDFDFKSDILESIKKELSKEIITDKANDWMEEYIDPAEETEKLLTDIPESKINEYIAVQELTVRIMISGFVELLEEVEL